MMNHPTPEEWMTYLYEKVGPDARSALALHLQACETCRAQVAAWRDTMRQLDQWRVSGRRARAPWMPGAIRWAAAAVILLAFGYGAGRLLRPSAPDMKALRQEFELSLRTSLETSIRDALRQELGKELKAAVAAYQAQYRTDLANLAEYTVHASKATTEGLLSVQGDLVKLAVLTDDELLRTQGDIAQLAALSGTPGHVPDGSGQPETFREGRER